MATIVANVKERLRSRSRHRYSTRGRSIDDSRPPLPSVAINGWQNAPGYDLPKSLRQAALAEPTPDHELSESPLDRALPQIRHGQGLGLDPTMLAQSLRNTPTSPEFPQAQVPPSPRNVPDRHSSLRRKDRPYTSDARGHRRMVSEPVSQSYYSTPAVPERNNTRPKSRHIPIASTSPQLGQYEAEQAAMERGRTMNESRQPPGHSYVSPANTSPPSGNRKSNESRHQAYVPIAQLSPKLNQYEAELAEKDRISSESQARTTSMTSNPRYPPRKDSLEHNERPRGRLPGHRLARSVDVAPNDPSPYMPRKEHGVIAQPDSSPYVPRTESEHKNLATAGTWKAIRVPDDVRIPEDFKLQSYVKTDVSTDWAPAVTQEVVHRQKTEIVQKAITRDIHIHHYYEYFQPIKVVEILPARHWFLDPKTGKKIEVPEPTGWKMPVNLMPTKPDTSTLRKKTRHYLVNDEHPRGIMESRDDYYDESKNRRLSVSSATAAAAA